MALIEFNDDVGGPKDTKVGSQNALLQGRSLWKTLLGHTVQDQIEISIIILTTTYGMLNQLPNRPQHYWLSGHSQYPSL